VWSCFSIHDHLNLPFSILRILIPPSTNRKTAGPVAGRPTARGHLQPSITQGSFSDTDLFGAAHHPLATPRSEGLGPWEAFSHGTGETLFPFPASVSNRQAASGDREIHPDKSDVIRGCL